MKKKYSVSLLLCLITFAVNSQSLSEPEVTLRTNLLNYAVTAVYDTTFSREAIIEVGDTMACPSITGWLSILTSSGWQTLQTNVLTNPADSDTTACIFPLCVYRENKNRRVVYLGSYSLTQHYRIQLHFNGTNSPDWVQEF